MSKTGQHEDEAIIELKGETRGSAIVAQAEGEKLATAIQRMQIAMADAESVAA